MPITYVGGWVIVQGDYSGSTNIFELIYNASVAGVWGIESQNRNEMVLTPTIGITFGQSTQLTPTIWKSQNENVLVSGRVRWGIGNIGNSTTGTLGVYDAVNDLSTDGCKIVYATPGAGDTVLDQYSTLDAYDTHITDNMGPGFSFATFNGVVEMIDVNLWAGNGYNLVASGSNFSRLKGTTGFFGILSGSGQTWNEIRTNLCVNGMSVVGDGTMQDATIINASNFTIATFGVGGGGTFFDFINCQLDYTDFVYYNAHTRLYRRQFTVDVITRTKDVANVPGFRVRAWDATQDPLVDGPLFDVTTGAGGDIAQQLITVETHQGLAGGFGVYTSLNPITFLFTKIGWREVWITATILDAVDYVLQVAELEKEDLRE